jgi:hypothetical protein
MGHSHGSVVIKLSEMKPQQMSAEFVTVSQLNNPPTRSCCGQVRSTTVGVRKSGHPALQLGKLLLLSLFSQTIDKLDNNNNNNNKRGN